MKSLVLVRTSIVIINKPPDMGGLFHACCSLMAFFAFRKAVIEKPMPYMMAIEPKPIAASTSVSINADMQKKQMVKRMMPMSPMVLMTFMSSP